MRTDRLIDILSADTRPGPPPQRRLLGALPVALAVSAIGLGLAFGYRGDLEAWRAPLVALKSALPLLVGLAALGLALRLARPGRSGEALARGLLAVGALVVAGFAAAVLATPAEARLAAVRGSTILGCLTIIPAMAVLPLAAALWALRQGASTAPALSGTAAGLAAGGLVATIYSFHCPEDDPAFYLLWYSLAVLIVAAAGRALGARLLRW
jgi:hypothetical protein